MSMSLKWDGVRAGEPVGEAAADIRREALAEAVKRCGRLFSHAVVTPIALFPVA